MAEWESYKNGCFQTTCKSLEEFIEIINDVYRLNNSILFRGHSKEKEYELISSIDRRYKSFSKELEDEPLPCSVDRTKYLNMHLTEFRKKIRGKVDSEIYFTDDERAWTLGQHYGLYTPYLDWTETPYIAAFFCALNNQEIDGCIYALNISFINELNKKANDNKTLKNRISNLPNTDYTLRKIQPMTNFNTRLNVQNGCFTLTPNGISIDDWIDCFESFKDKYVLRKIIIKADLKSELLIFLEKVNINYSTVYPDLEGISKYCNTKLETIEKDAKAKILANLMITQINE
ncbi:MAG: FRG domain-containing protein [Spirochaetaceae bacterium]|nr:FRG domain-containing protein [Spirochaetaceae bacterium]